MLKKKFSLFILTREHESEKDYYVNYSGVISSHIKNVVYAKKRIIKKVDLLMKREYFLKKQFIFEKKLLCAIESFYKASYVETN